MACHIASSSHPTAPTAPTQRLPARGQPTPVPSQWALRPNPVPPLMPSQWPHQNNVKTSPGLTRGVMVPLVLLVHPDPPWSTYLLKFEKVWIRMDRSGSGGPRGPRPPLVDQERSGPPWTTLRHFPDADLPLPYLTKIPTPLSSALSTTPSSRKCSATPSCMPRPSHILGKRNNSGPTNMICLFSPLPRSTRAML